MVKVLLKRAFSMILRRRRNISRTEKIIVITLADVKLDVEDTENRCFILYLYLHAGDLTAELF